MTNESVAKTVYKWKPYATRPKGRPRVRWEDDVRNVLRKMGVTNWKQRIQERKQWKEIIEQAKTHKELWSWKKKKKKQSAFLPLCES
jgi:hypothetical protein